MYVPVDSTLEQLKARAGNKNYIMDCIERIIPVKVQCTVLHVVHVCTGTSTTGSNLVIGATIARYRTAMAMINIQANCFKLPDLRSR